MPEDPRPAFDPRWPVWAECPGVRLEFHEVCVAHLPDLAEYEPNGVLGLRVRRSLRKSFEDSKNEAGAGDFYYGEMAA